MKYPTDNTENGSAQGKYVPPDLEIEQIEDLEKTLEDIVRMKEELYRAKLEKYQAISTLKKNKNKSEDIQSQVKDDQNENERKQENPAPQPPVSKKREQSPWQNYSPSHTAPLGVINEDLTHIDKKASNYKWIKTGENAPVFNKLLSEINSSIPEENSSDAPILGFDVASDTSIPLPVSEDSPKDPDAIEYTPEPEHRKPTLIFSLDKIPGVPLPVGEVYSGKVHQNSDEESAEEAKPWLVDEPDVSEETSLQAETVSSPLQTEPVPDFFPPPPRHTDRDVSTAEFSSVLSNSQRLLMHSVLSSFLDNGPDTELEISNNQLRESHISAGLNAQISPGISGSDSNESVDLLIQSTLLSGIEDIDNSKNDDEVTEITRLPDEFIGDQTEIADETEIEPSDSSEEEDLQDLETDENTIEKEELPVSVLLPPVTSETPIVIPPFAPGVSNPSTNSAPESKSEDIFDDEDADIFNEFQSPVFDSENEDLTKPTAAIPSVDLMDPPPPPPIDEPEANDHTSEQAPPQKSDEFNALLDDLDDLEDMFPEFRKEIKEPVNEQENKSDEPTPVPSESPEELDFSFKKPGLPVKIISFGFIILALTAISFAVIPAITGKKSQVKKAPPPSQETAQVSVKDIKTIKENKKPVLEKKELVKIVLHPEAKPVAVNPSAWQETVIYIEPLKTNLAAVKAENDAGADRMITAVLSHPSTPINAQKAGCPECVKNGNEFMSKGRFYKAVSEYNKSLKIAPSDGETRALLSLAYHSMKKDRLALKEVDLSLRYHPNNPWALLVGGSTMQLQGDYYRAVDYFSRYLAIRDDHPFKTDVRKLLGTLMPLVKNRRTYDREVPYQAPPTYTEPTQNTADPSDALLKGAL
ncbi:hypothetical protein KKF34_05315 [Myxococcota bacterium]|nr:hypothetical protein [Myxococcota bacterium]MBU1379222.1 hypothetical protein [Myxococcota bacterium]MBU1496279.1 hypothetical protein [Myxococcota bacterium]